MPPRRAPRRASSGLAYLRRVAAGVLRQERSSREDVDGLSHGFPAHLGLERAHRVRAGGAGCSSSRRPALQGCRQVTWTRRETATAPGSRVDACLRRGCGIVRRSIGSGEDPSRIVMWELSNRTRFAAERAFARDRDGAEVLLVVVKATFAIGPDGALRVADEQVPVARVPRRLGDPGSSSLLHDADFALRKSGRRTCSSSATRTRCTGFFHRRRGARAHRRLAEAHPRGRRPPLGSGDDGAAADGSRAVHEDAARLRACVRRQRRRG